MRIAPTGCAIGAWVEGVNLADLPSPDTIEAIETALEAHGVLIFPDQDITPSQQVAFSRAFAELERTLRLDARHPDAPEIFVVGNTGKELVSFAPADGSDQLEWHADHMHLPVTARASLFYCLETPPEGGDTVFACMYGGFDALSPAEQAEAEGLVACHSASGLQAFLRAKGHQGAADQVYDVDQARIVRWPLVRHHPRTGRRALYFGAEVTVGIDGWAPARAQTYLKALTAKATAPALRYRHAWSVGDVVFWDNRRVLHAGTPFDAGAYRRCMHRTTFREDQPVA